jgi:hypothetical protein
MKPKYTLKRAAQGLLASGLLFAVPPLAHAVESTDTVAVVSSRTSEDYSRARLSDGSYQSETYAFGEGGYYRAPIRDETIDRESFLEIAQALNGPLTAQKYLPTKDPEKANLLIMVYWGMTSGTIDPESDNFAYNRIGRVLNTRQGAFVRPDPYGPVSVQGQFIDAQNAVILGYDSDLSVPGGYEITALHVKHDDLVDEIEHNRFFVVLMAYDFQMMWKQKKHKLLWETRFSIRQQHNDFSKMLPAIVNYSSQYFGQDTKGLVRRPLPAGNVEVGVPRSIGIESEKNDSPTQTTLIVGPNTFSSKVVEGKPDTPALPAALADHIASYQRERAALQKALAAKIESRTPGDDTSRAIDSFNVEHSVQIAALNQDAEKIRGELAKFANAYSEPAAAQSIDALIQQFDDRIKAMKLGESLFAHP